MNQSATKTECKDERVVLGIDLGGTKILSAVITGSGEILSRAKKKTRSQLSTDEILQRLLACAQSAIEKSEVPIEKISAIGIGSPGPLDPVKGIVLHTPNLNFVNTPLAPFLQENLGKPAFLDNDVNIGTLGEFVYGAGKDKNDVVGIFLGTGIGGGIVINGEMLHGKSFNAGEIGHMKVKAGGAICGCGQSGCLEAYASKTAMVNRFKKAVEKGKKTVLTEMIGEEWTKLNSTTFYKAYQQNDRLVVDEIHRAAKYCGIAAGSLINVLSPEMIIFGGGIMQEFGPVLLERIKMHAKKNCFEMIYDTVEFSTASLGDDSGILGAAALALRKSA